MNRTAKTAPSSRSQPIPLPRLSEGESVSQSNVHAPGERPFDTLVRSVFGDTTAPTDYSSPSNFSSKTLQMPHGNVATPRGSYPSSGTGMPALAGQTAGSAPQLLSPTGLLLRAEIPGTPFMDAPSRFEERATGVPPFECDASSITQAYVNILDFASSPRVIDHDAGSDLISFGDQGSLDYGSDHVPGFPLAPQTNSTPNITPVLDGRRLRGEAVYIGSSVSSQSSNHSLLRETLVNNARSSNTVRSPVPVQGSPVQAPGSPHNALHEEMPFGSGHPTPSGTPSSHHSYLHGATAFSGGDVSGFHQETSPGVLTDVYQLRIHDFPYYLGSTASTRQSTQSFQSSVPPCSPPYPSPATHYGATRTPDGSYMSFSSMGDSPSEFVTPSGVRYIQAGSYHTSSQARSDASSISGIQSRGILSHPSPSCTPPQVLNPPGLGYVSSPTANVNSGSYGGTHHATGTSPHAQPGFAHSVYSTPLPSNTPLTQYQQMPQSQNHPSHHSQPHSLHPSFHHASNQSPSIHQHQPSPRSHQSPVPHSSHASPVPSAPPSSHGAAMSPPAPQQFPQQTPQQLPPISYVIQMAGERKKPSTDTLPELTSISDFGPWHMEMQRIAVDNGLWPHVASPQPEGLPYVSGLDPVYMPEDPREQDAWWKVDGIMSTILLEKLSKSIRGLAPVSSGVSRVTARDIYMWILDRYGLNDYTVFQALEAELTRTMVGNKLTVEEYCRNWLEKLSIMRSSAFPVEQLRLSSAFALGLPVNDPHYTDLIRAITSGTVRWDITRYIRDAQAIDRRLTSQAKSRAALMNWSPKSARGSSTTTASSSLATANLKCTNCGRTTHLAKDCFQPGGAMEGKQNEVMQRKREERSSRSGGAGSSSKGGQKQKDAGTATIAAVAPTPVIHHPQPPPPPPAQHRPAQTPVVTGTGAHNDGGDNVPTVVAQFVAPNNIALDLCVALPAFGMSDEEPAPRRIYRTREELMQELESTLPTAMRANKSSLSLALAAFNALLDSGCSMHLFKDRALFWDFDDSPSSRLKVGTANCGSFVTQGRGTIKFAVMVKGVRVEMRLKNCLYSPDLPINLLSIGALLEKDIEVLFTKGPKCTVVLPDNHPQLKGCSFEATMMSRLPFLYLDLMPAPPEQLMSCVTMDVTASVAVYSRTTWHRRCAHAGPDAIKELLNYDYATGVSSDGKLSEDPCPTCVVGKRAAQKYANNAHRASNLLDLIHIDIAGPFPVLTTDKKKYFLVILDDYSNYAHVSLLSTRTSNEVSSVFSDVIRSWERTTGWKVRQVRMDGAAEFTGGEFATMLSKEGISPQVTVAHAHQQSGKAERYVRLMEDTLLTVLADSDLPRSYWGYAVLFGAWVRNRMPTSTLPRGCTAYERFHGTKPDLSQLRVFGCLCFLLIPKELRKKDDLMRYPAIFVGFREGTLGWVVVSLDGKRTTTRDAIFYENVPGRLRSGRSNADSIPYITRTILNDSSSHNSHHPSVSRFLSDDSASPSTDQHDRLLATRDERLRTLRPRHPIVSKFAYTLLSDLSLSAVLSFASSSSFLEMPPEYSLNELTNDFIMDQILIACAADRNRFLNPRLKEVDLTRAPRTYWEAIRRPDAVEWKAAMREEYSSLNTRNAYTLVTLPPGRVAIELQWTFAVKLDQHAKPIPGPKGKKARTVARGDKQLPEDCPGPTAAPVAGMPVVRQIVAYAAGMDYEIMSFDVKTAFLHAPLDEEIYCKQIPGFPERDPNLVLRLNVALYGLRQSAHVFYNFLNGIMMKIGLRRLDISHAVWIGVWSSPPDPSIRMPGDGSPLILIIPVHVDDGLVVTNSTALYDWFIRRMGECGVEVKDLGPVTLYLGVRFIRDRPSRRLWLSQEGYITDVLSRYGLLDCHITRVPLPKSIHTVATTPDPNDSTALDPLGPEDAMHYLVLTGIITYLASCTRADLAFAAMSLGQYSSRPNKALLRAAKGVLRYLSGTRNFALSYPAPTSTTPDEHGFIRPPTCGMSDADWASDEAGRKSVSGYAFFYENSLVTWSAVRQRTVSLSSTEAEYYALAHAMREALWFRLLLTSMDMNLPSPFPLFVDNQSTLALADSHTVSTRSKHIDVRYHFIRDHIRSNLFSTDWCPTGSMTADIFTKPLSYPTFSILRTSLGISPVPVLSV